MEYPKRLYKYLIPDRIDILNNNLIRFTQPSALNDPFELKPIFGDLLSEHQLKEAIEPPFEYIEDALRRDYENLTNDQKAQISVEQIITIVRENPQIIKTIMRDIEPVFRKLISNFTPKAKEMLTEALNAKVGILSLSETISNSLLWAHYADSHKGFAIEFNAEHSFFNRRRSDKDELFHLRKVKYKDRSSLGRTLMDLDGDDLLVTKETCWAYEAEWRILAPLESADSVLKIENDEIYLFTIPSSAITGIIVGSRATEFLYEEIKTHLQLLDNHQIDLKKAVVDTENQKIKIVGI
jgi:hypothetical protein